MKAFTFNVMFNFIQLLNGQLFLAQGGVLFNRQKPKLTTEGLPPDLTQVKHVLIKIIT